MKSKKTKMKTRQSIAKRFKITKSGKVLHRASFSRHLQSKKKKSTKRQHRILQKTLGKDKINIKKLLGGLILS